MRSRANIRIPDSRVRRYRTALCGQCGLLVLLLAGAIVDPASYASYEALIYPLCVLLLTVFVWSIFSWKLVTGSLIDPYVLFLSAAALFNGGQAFLEVFHLNERGILDGSFSSETLFKTLCLVLITLVALHFGALISAGMMRRPDSRNSVAPETRLDTRIIGWTLVLISFLPTVIYIQSCLSIVMSYGYAGLYREGFSIGFGSIFRVLAIFLVPGALFLLAGSRGARLNIIIASVLLLLFSVTNLFMGHRTSGGYPLLAFAWLWHKTIRPLSTRTLVTFALVMMIVLPLVASIRSISGEDRSSLAFIYEAFLLTENPLVAVVREMGGSMGTICYTTELVPWVRHFDNGMGYLRASMTLVPSLYWGSGETYGSWLTWTILPRFAKIGGGMGFSFVAEAYANFGWIGVPVFMFVLGLLYARLVLWVELSKDVACKAMMASFVVFFIAYSRGESAGEVGRLFWAAYVPYLAVVQLRYLRAKAQLTKNDGIILDKV